MCRQGLEADRAGSFLLEPERHSLRACSVQGTVRNPQNPPSGSLTVSQVRGRDPHPTSPQEGVVLSPSITEAPPSASFLQVSWLLSQP